MSKKVLYSKTRLSRVRLLAILATIIFAISILYKCWSASIGLCSIADASFSIIPNIITVALCILLSIFPMKLELLAILAFIYSFICFFDDCNPMAICMYFLGVSTLSIRGFYNTQKKNKYSCTVIIYFLLWLISLKYGIKVFVNEIFERVAYTFPLAITTIFLQEKRKFSSYEKDESILNLAEYPKLYARDAKWLNMIKNHIKYAAIASEDYVSIGTVKNRLHEIYSILEVADKQGFLDRYADSTIIYKK